MEHNNEHNSTQGPSLRRRMTIAGVCLALAVPVVGLASYGIAGASDGGDHPEEVVDDCGVDLTPEEVAASNEEQDALAAFLDERGIHYTREPDEDGVRWVTWDENYEAANAAVDEFDAARMSPDDVAAYNAEQDRLAAFLDERGIAYTRRGSADGPRDVVWDEDDEAANAAVDEYYDARFPAPRENVALINAQEDELAAFLDERGIAYTNEPDEDGFRWVVWDENDEAANAAVDEFYESQPDHSCAGMVEVDAG